MGLVLGCVAGLLLPATVSGQLRGSSEGAAVDPPVGWYSGDTHDHIQLCLSPVNITASDILGKMLVTELDVASVLIWGPGILSQSDFDAYMSNVTGREDPVSSGLPQVVQFGVEVSGFQASKLGHVIGLNIGNAQTAFYSLGLGCPGLGDTSGDYSAPVLDLFRDEPRAVTGFAHVEWPIDTYADQTIGGWDWENPLLPGYVGVDARCSFGQDMAFPGQDVGLTHIHPPLASIDVATRRIDFLESVDMQTVLHPGEVEESWYGMYYKLLSAGLPVSISGGSDGDCIGLSAPPRTWVLIDPGATLDYDQWTRNLAAGRVSLATGSNQFLELEVDGQPPGSRLELVTPIGGGPAVVDVRLTYMHRGAPAVTDTLEVVLDGEVIQSQVFGPLENGSQTFQVSVPVSRSGWIAARTRSQGTHTAAVHLYLDGKPVANCAEAEYWTLHCDYTNFLFDKAVAGGFIQQYTGCSEMEIRDYIAEGRAVFAALRDFDSPLPDETIRFGTSSPPECTPPLGIVTNDAPVIGTQVNFRCFNAPSHADGWLILGLVPHVSGMSVNGAELHIDPLPGTFVLVDATTNAAGYAEASSPSLPSLVGLDIYAQFVWLNPVGCSGTGKLSSSDALALRLTP